MVEQSSAVAPQIENQGRRGPNTLESLGELRHGIRPETVHLYITNAVGRHVSRIDGTYGNIAAHYLEIEHTRRAFSHDFQLHPAALRTAEQFGDIGTLRTYRRTAVHAGYAVAGSDTDTLGRPAGNGAHDYYRIAENIELDAYASETAVERLHGIFHLFGRKVCGMGIELGQHAAYALFDHGTVIERIDIMPRKQAIKLGEFLCLCSRAAFGLPV